MDKYIVSLTVKDSSGKIVKEHVFLTTEIKKEATGEFNLIVQSDKAVRNLAKMLDQ